MDFIELDNLDGKKDADKILAIVNPFIEDQRRRYQDRHIEWEKNILFFLGKHWIEKKDGVNGFVIYEEDNDHFYPVTNYTKKFTYFKMNQVAGKKIVPVVRPTNLNPSDVLASRLNHLALQARYEMDDEAHNDRLVFLHASIFGIGWRVNYKEPDPLKYIERPRMETLDQGQYKCDQCGIQDPQLTNCPNCMTDMPYQENMVTQQATNPETGDPAVDRFPLYKITSDVPDPFRIMVSSCHSKRNRKWLTETSLQPTRWLKEAFGVKGPGFLPDNVGKIQKTEDLPRQIRISEDLKKAFELKNSSVINSVAQKDSIFKNDEDSSLLYKLYLKPMGNHKKGRLLIFTPTALLYDGKPDIPDMTKLRNRWHPYSDFVFNVAPMNSEGISLIGDMIPLNKVINAIDAMILEHLDKTAAPQEVRFDNVKMNNDDNTDGVMIVKPIPNMPQGGAPFYLQHPQIANEVYEYRAAKVAEMEKLANVPEVAQGIRPQGVDTFRGLKLLRDSAEGTEGDVYNRWNEHVKEYSTLKLCLIKDCYVDKDEEMVEMMTTLNEDEGNNESEIQAFLGSRVGDRWNISIEETDYLSQTQGAEEEAVTDAVKNKIIDPEEMADPLVKFNILQKIGLGSSVDTLRSDDIKKANWLVQLLEAKDFDRVKLAAAKPFDNMPLQYRVLTSWMKKPKFYSLDQEIQDAADQLRVQIQTIMTQSMKPPPPSNNAPMQGPGGPGGPPPPVTGGPPA